MRIELGPWRCAGFVVIGMVAVALGAAPPISRPFPKPWTGTIKAHKHMISGLAVTSDGGTLFTSGDRKIALWDLRTGKLVRERIFDDMTPTVRTTVFVNRNAQLASEVVDDVYLFDCQTLKTKAILEQAGRYGADTLATSPDGGYLAGSKVTSLGVWDVAKGKILWRKEFKRGKTGFSIDRLAFSPDSKVLALGVTDDKEVIHLLDARTGRELRLIAGERRGPVCGPLFTSNGHFLVVTSRWDNHLYIWDARTWEIAHRIQMQAGKKRLTVWTLALSSDGKTLFVCCEAEVRLYETATWELRHSLPLKTVNVLPCPGDRIIWKDLTDNQQGWVHISAWRELAKPGRRTNKELAQLWDALGTRDAGTAFRAISELLATPGQATALLSALPRADPATHRKLARLIAELDDENFEVRDRASRELNEVGQVAEAQLRVALADSPSLEARKRIAGILRGLDSMSPQRLRLLRGVEVLEAVATPTSMKELERLAGGAEGAEETMEARAALVRLRKRVK